ncbi:MAG TPA: MFS transporter [Bryobacteraceae bacterium]|nr:MFS transporter [Bryobacteraceae bacterium]
MSPKTALLESNASATLAPVARATLFSLTLFCVTHFVIDMYSGALGALQPLLVDQFHMSFTEAGILAGVLSFSSSVLQPGWGYLSDRFHSHLFTALAPAVAGLFISSVGLAPSYPVLMAMVFLGGAGIASFHPHAASNATHGIARNRQRAMAIFISSGTLGLALGPTFFSEVSGRLGLPRTWWAALPGVAMSLLLLIFLRSPERPADKRPRFDWAPLRAVWKPMTILYFLVFIRSIVQVTFTQLLPLYLHTQRGYSLASSSLNLTLYLGFGAVGGVVGGNLADRFGGRRVIIFSMIASVPFLVLFVFSTGWLSTAALSLGGLILLFTNPVNVVMGQELAPTQAGTVSAMMMGFAWGTAGLLFIPLTGWISDLYSMQTAFIALVLFPLIGFFLALKLPKEMLAAGHIPAA